MPWTVGTAGLPPPFTFQVDKEEEEEESVVHVFWLGYSHVRDSVTSCGSARLGCVIKHQTICLQSCAHHPGHGPHTTMAVSFPNDVHCNPSRPSAGRSTMVLASERCVCDRLVLSSPWKWFSWCGSCGCAG